MKKVVSVTEKRWGWLDIVGNLGIEKKGTPKADLLRHIGPEDTPVRLTITYEVER